MLNSKAFVKRVWRRITLPIRVAMIRSAARRAQETYMERCWIENDKEGFTGWRWDKYNVKLEIVCAANRYKDFIITGSRHHSVPMQMVTGLIGMDALRAYSGDDGEEQGFIDQYGTYWDRESAYKHCIAQGRPLLEAGRSTVRLFSEHLY